MTARRKKEYPSQEIEILKKFYETLCGSSFGLLWVVGSLLCEAAILLSVLFQAINEILVEQSSSHFDEPFWENNRFLLKVLIFCMNVLDEIKKRLPLRMLLTGTADHGKKNQDSALVLVKLGLARRSNRQPGCRIVFHPITQALARRKGGLLAAQATIQSIRRFIKTTALPLTVHAFTTFSRCNSALELLKICTSALNKVEKSFAARIEDWCYGSLCWKKKQKSNLNPRMDECLWQDTTLLKAMVLETRAKLLM
ncbi:hypothetical protein Hdeb2414_s0001g00015621 [Helianthus debilis subsp. tardiflorus]